MAVMTRSREDKIFDFFNYLILTLFLLVVLYPLYFIVIASFSDPNQVNAGKVWLIPKDITLEGYERIFNDSNIWLGYRNTIFYTVMGTIINVVLTLTSAYALSRKDLYGRNFFMGMMVFTMMFGGGLIPRYLLIKDLGMLDTVWAMIIPNAVGVWNVIISRTFFQTTIPDELFEAATIDGCSNTRFFTRIVLPLSPALIAVMVLFYGVGHWNAFFDAMIYLKNSKLYPLQLILRDILIKNEMQSQMLMEDAETVAAQQRIAETIKYGVIIVASVPVMILYPFLQKYFVKGVMIGAIKG